MKIKEMKMTMKIYHGANGYYVAYEREDGSHYQPDDNGARLGWDRAAAERELRRRSCDDDSDIERR
jgi:hypothetical protein